MARISNYNVAEDLLKDKLRFWLGRLGIAQDTKAVLSIVRTLSCGYKVGIRLETTLLCAYGTLLLRIYFIEG